MPAPTNISAATATIIASLPYSTSQNVNDAGTTYTVWYVYIPTSDGMVTIWGFGDLVTYKPTLQIFSPDGTTDHATGSGINVPIQFYGLTGIPFYFKFSSSTGNVGAATLTLTASDFVPSLPVPVGSFAVPDDHVGLPLGFFSATANDTPLDWVFPFPSGYSVDVLANGLVGIENNVNEVANGDIVFDLIDASNVTLAELTWAMPASGWQQTYIGGNRVDRFYVGWPFDYDNFSGDSSFRIVQENGTASAAVDLTGVTTLAGLAPNNDDTVLYVGVRQGAGDYRIKQWDIVNGVFLADLAANVTDYRPHDMLVLSDDSVVVLYREVGGAGNRRIVVYSDAGATISSTDYGAYDTRLAYDADYSVFWAVMVGTVSSGTLGSATFRKVNPATGADITTRTYFGFDNGVYEGAATATPPSFGISADSSAFWLTRESIEPPSEQPPVITSIINTNTGSSVNPMYCARPIVQRVTLVGTAFQDGLTVTGTDPLNQALVITIESVSETAIEISFSTDQYGRFWFYVTNPDAFVSSPFSVDSFSCSEPVTMRRLRRAAHLSDENQWTFYKSFTLDYEAGVGLNSGQGSDPEILLRWSDDGGHQWSDYHPMKIGKMGKYTHRAIWRRLGRSRKRLFEVVCTDPVKLVLLDAFLDIESGTS